jgi:hypothetical protein
MDEYLWMGGLQVSSKNRVMGSKVDVSLGLYLVVEAKYRYF